MFVSNNVGVFLEFVKAGLWEQECRSLHYGEINYRDVYLLARNQAVIGLVAAGIEHAKDTLLSREGALSFVADTVYLEQRNAAMNAFVAELVEQLRNKGIYTLLVKGQGVAQCYERPLWRAAGDIDLFLEGVNYQKAKHYLSEIALAIEKENPNTLHLGMTISKWEVELHGTLRTNLWKKLDCVIDEIQKDVFYSGAVRCWMDGETPILLPRADEDIVLVFSHIIQHFFIGGVGLRQVCDWCRVLWTFNDKIDYCLLKNRIVKGGIMTEWNTFAAFAVEYLGMPIEAMPFYDSKNKWKKKAAKVLSLIIKNGNMGHNRDISYQRKESVIIRKVVTMGIIIRDMIRQCLVFPIDSIRVGRGMARRGIKRLLIRE